MFEGGGGCFSYATCAEGSPWFDDSVSQLDDPAAGGGLLDLERADNPFRDYSVVFIRSARATSTSATTCTLCGGGRRVTIRHRGLANARAALSTSLPDRDHRLRDRLLRRKRRRGLPHAGDPGRYPRARVTYFGDSLAFVLSARSTSSATGAATGCPPWADVDPRRFTMTRYLAELAHRYPRRTFARFNHAGDAVQERHYLAAGGPPGGFETGLQGRRGDARAHRAELPLLPRLRLGPLRDVRRPLLHPGAGRRPPPRLGRPARAAATCRARAAPARARSAFGSLGQCALVDDARSGRVLDGVAGGLVDGELVLRGPSARDPAITSPSSTAASGSNWSSWAPAGYGWKATRDSTASSPPDTTSRPSSGPSRDAPTDVTCAPGASHSRLSTARPHPCSSRRRRRRGRPPRTSPRARPSRGRAPPHERAYGSRPALAERTHAADGVDVRPALDAGAEDGEDGGVVAGQRADRDRRSGAGPAAVMCVPSMSASGEPFRWSNTAISAWWVGTPVTSFPANTETSFVSRMPST